MTSRMVWASALSEQVPLDAAADEACGALIAALGGVQPDVIFVFVSALHAARYTRLAPLLRQHFPDAVLFGCSGGGIVGDGHEVEQAVALSLVAAHLPNVELVPFALTPTELASPELDAAGWRARLGIEPAHQPSFILLPDPFPVETDRLLDGLDAAFPRCPKVGGLASGGRPMARNALFLNDDIRPEGLIGLALYGDVALDPVVAQGCRPIGPPYKITERERNLLLELDGLPALSRLEALFSALSGADQELFQQTPLVGLGVDPSRASPRHGEYLIRNLIGLDRKRGLIGVGAMLEPGQVLRFHVRDATSADEDLRELLGRYQRESTAEPPAGALLFSCLGRGEGLYGAPDHDSQVFRELIGDLPMGGLFCNGEIGPVQDRSHLHGYTSAFALFRPRGWN